MTLTEILDDPATFRSVVDDSARIIEEEVAAKRGLSGKALRAGYRTVKAIKPGLIQAAIASLLPDFAPVVDPFWQRARESGAPEGYLREHSGELADALLGVTDRRANRARSRVMKRVYRSLRGRARAHTAGSVPRLSVLIAKYDR